MNQSDAKAALKKYGSTRAAARALGISPRSFGRALAGTRVVNVPSSHDAKVGRNIGEFRAAYNKDFIVPAKLREALKRLGAAWEYEVAFAKLAGVSMSDIAVYREGFADFVVQLREGRRAWAGTKRFAQQMREML